MPVQSTTQQNGSADERILAAAAARFARFGYNGVSMRDIASDANVNEVTVYRHYRRKRDLYCAMLEAELGKVRLGGDLLSRLAQAQDARAAMERTFELIATIMKQDPNLMRLVYFSVLELGDDVAPLLRKHLSELIEVVAGYLHPWIVGGDLEAVNPRALVVSMAAVAFSEHSFSRIFFDRTSDQHPVFRDLSGYVALRGQKVTGRAT